jgi:GH24 family phage-related lysozyme (muramidase)
MNTARLYSDLKTAEGVRCQAYKDSRGYWTGGVGHFLDQSVDWTGQRFSPGQVDAWLQQDVATAIANAQAQPEWKALDTDARQNALCELVFNMGTAKWDGFVHDRQAMSAQDWPTVKAQLADSAWAKQVGTARSQRIENYLLTGEFDGGSAGQSAA